MVSRDKKGHFIKGHKESLGNKYRQGISPWNKGHSKKDLPTLSGGRPLGAKDTKKRDTTNYKISPERREQMRQISLRLGIKPPKVPNECRPRGEKHSNWKGGITPINEAIRRSTNYRLWRKAVLERDNFTCQKTGVKGGILRVHHINNFAYFPELRFAIDNGITLSEKAHIEFHKRYGKKNNTKAQLEEYLNTNE